MPLLARETDLFPDDLLDSAALVCVADRDWEVVHTLPRREKDLAPRLLALEIPFFRPQVEQRTRSPGGRRRVSYRPMFPGYLFLSAADDQRGQVIDTGCVARLLSVPDPEELLFDLRQIHEL